jgi:hypothetical protein
VASAFAAVNWFGERTREDALARILFGGWVRKPFQQQGTAVASLGIRAKGSGGVGGHEGGHGALLDYGAKRFR